MSHAEVLKMLRTAYHNYDTKTVAKSLGITRPYLNELESGKKNVSPSIIQKLAGLYNVPTVKLTRLFRDLGKYDISGVEDYQKALAKTLLFLLKNKFKVN